MNKTYKVVFNKVRGALMVTNEATSSVQKKGTKAVVATALASMLICGAASAEDISYSQTEGNTGYSATSSENQELTFASDNVLNMAITGNDTRAYGLLASGANHQYTNEGKIVLNQATDEAAPTWQTKGMMADAGGTVVNKGIIDVTNAYGMTVGSSAGSNNEPNTIINDVSGVINVNGGVGIEGAPTGTSGTTGTAKAIVTNNGTINVTNGTGILVSGNDGLITNNGTISAKGQTAVHFQKEDSHTAADNKLVFGASSSTIGKISIDKDVKNTTIIFEEGSTFDGRIVDYGTSSSISGSVDISNQTISGDAAGAAIYLSAYSTLDLSNSTFSNNKITGTDIYGGAIYSYGSPVALENSTFSGNSLISAGANVTNYGVGAAGGAVMLKGNEKTVFTDVVFTNNSATALKTDSSSGGCAYGGALMVDFSTGAVTDVERASDVTFKITKDLIYSGNTVSSDSTASYFDTYGYHLSHAQAGGFLFLDRGSSATFDIDEGKTLTIGSSVTNDDTDGIASSIPNTGTTKNEGKHASITKTGVGTLVVNGSLDKYYGTLTIKEGSAVVNSTWTLKNEVSVEEGATLTLADFGIATTENSGNQNVEGNALAGLLKINGTLQTSSDQIFTQAANQTQTSAGALRYTDKQISLGGKGTIALNDASYTLEYAQSVGDVFGKTYTSGKIELLGTLVGQDGNTLTLDQVENIASDVSLNTVTVTSENRALQIGGITPSDENTAYRENGLTVGSLELGSANQVTVTGGETLGLVGNGDQLISTTASDDLSVTINSSSTLSLGGTNSQGGVLSGTVTVGDGSKVVVTGGSTFEITTLKGTGSVLVGNSDSAGNLNVTSLEGFTGKIFVDPAWGDGVNNVSSASSFGVYEATDLKAQIVAGQNSVVALGAAGLDAVSAFEKISAATGLQWGTDVTAAAYVAQPIGITDGGVLVNGSLTSGDTASVTPGTVTVATKGMLIADQAAAPADGTAMINGSVSLEQGSYLGLTNATEGVFKLANSIADAGTQIVTDNPFISAGAIDAANGTVTTSLDAANGLGALASTGLQAMTRRADSVLAGTIADRTSIDQELNAGINLWVDVAGENYQSDNFDNGGSFEADMGYGTFGGDMAFGAFTAGAAFQYGTGSLRSSVSSIKNSIDNYAFALYGTYKVTDAFKLAAELAYVWGENDITSSQAALNQSIDTEMYSFGLRAMYELKTGNFSFVPSIGLRVSQLSTDAFQVGSVKVEDQDQTLVQVPIALRINASEFDASGWSVAPSFKIAYVPTFGDKDIEVLNHTQDVIDTAPVQADFGLRIGKDNMMFNVNMLLGAGEYGTSAIGGKVGFKYAF